MTDLQSSAAWPEDFCGIAKLFPLPNLVLFPHVVQPLHVFESRYCEMLADAMATDHLIAMALLQSGWEENFLGCPPIASTVCVGKIVSNTPTEDGRHNILLVGVKRARIIKELPTKRTYREAEVEILDDFYPTEEVDNRQETMERLQELFAHFVPEGLAAQESFKQLVGKQLPLGILTDTITYALNLPLAIKQQLLAEKNVDVRCRILIRCLEQKVSKERDEVGGGPAEDFPPRFSEN